ncbi:hypothetical protein ACGFZP_34040 [Kitasatospora sp. NPDC048239]|uniref:hypothetical protein n=1 Tax=Kitasatospora sp. NPDC048239 TaxID=3364046 RepID=UPI003717A18F
MSSAKPATAPTAAANQQATGRYAMEDRQDFAFADRGLVAPLPGRVLREDGHVLFDPADFAYLAEDAPCPDTVNPSLWRQSQVLAKGGLFKVTDRIYQVRNNDIANLAFVEGDRGLVVIDCTESIEAAAQGWAPRGSTRARPDWSAACSTPGASAGGASGSPYSPPSPWVPPDTPRRRATPLWRRWRPGTTGRSSSPRR